MNMKIKCYQLILLSSLLAMTLMSTSCTSHISAAPEDNTTPRQNYQTTDSNREEIEYYKQVIAELEQKLRTSNEEKYISDTENKLIINELQSEISELKNILEQIEQQTEEITNPIKTDDISSVVQKEFSYTLDNGSATITGYLGNSQIIYIPSSIDGYPVVCIGEKSFYKVEATKIYIPLGVTTIDWFAFYECKNLSDITIPFTVNSVKYGAFDGCPSSLTIHCSKGSYIEAYAMSWRLNISSK